jgi:hypothetical protein
MEGGPSKSHRRKPPKQLVAQSRDFEEMPEPKTIYGYPAVLAVIPMFCVIL